jgi:PadR family transcriptional regulator, regulatory protein PadR
MTNKQKADLLRGALDLLILRALGLGPTRGHGVGQEEKEWIKSDWGVSENNRRARFYKLTPAGRKQLNIEKEKRMSRIDLSSALKEGVQGSGGGVQRRLLTNILGDCVGVVRHYVGPNESDRFHESIE